MKDFLLTLDFDGVLWDSAGECFVTARRAWEALEGSAAPVSEAAFRRGRWLVRAGGEFGLVLRLLLEEPGRDLEFFPLERFGPRSEEEDAWMQRFERAFYGERARARREEPEAWVSSQAPYPEVLAELPALREAFREVVICTTKDESSARELLGTAGLELPILAKEFSLDKRDQMRHLVETRGVPTERIVFVDDLFPNLDPVSGIGVRVALAGWGYNTAAVRALARERGIPVLRPGHLMEGLSALVARA